MPENREPSLSELRQQRGGENGTFGGKISEFFHAKFPFLFDIKSLFYFFWLVVLLGFAWMAYALMTNGFTTLYNWDYTWQYVPIGYYTHDVWRNFFKTGYFDLYSSETFLGADNIGSNAYYGLLDPYMIWMVIFPRSWVPQLMAVSSALKGAVGALCMRAYLRYRGIGERNARLGGFAYAFTGFLNFMVGFPSVVSIVSIFPLVLLGIEKTIKEKKPTWLAIGIFLTGLMNFFYIVVFCVFGVIYAMWRFFFTIRERKGWKSNLLVIGIGIFGFAVGLMMCSFVLFPSLRNSALSGRTTSIGQAYLHYLIDSLKAFDLGAVFSTVFSMVGDSPGRELMCLISFFYPTVNYAYLPLAVPAGGGYDAWTASLFCYTPIMILFIYALIGAVRRREWGVLSGFGLGAIACFTCFSYYFFFVFSGDGYGRWLVVLVPIIIYYAMREFENIKHNPDWQILTASCIAVFMTILTLAICHAVLDGEMFLSDNNLTYYRPTYISQGMSWTVYVVFYQILLVIVEGCVIFYLRYKPYLSTVLMAFLALETIVSGNISFSARLWDYYNSFEGGTSAHAQMSEAAEYIAEYDASQEEGDSFYRVYTDYYNVKNDGLTYGYGGASHFHSLFNYDLVDFARITGITHNEGREILTYGGYSYTNKVWSASYNNKRLGFDTLTGHRYYVIRNEGYSFWNDEDFRAYNVPFGSKEIYKNDSYRIYDSGLYTSLGHGVDNVYKMNVATTGTGGENEPTPNQSDFYNAGGGSNLSYTRILCNEYMMGNGVIVEDDDAESLPDDIEVLNETPGQGVYTQPNAISEYTYLNSRADAYFYQTKEEYGGFHTEDPGLFLRDDTWLDSTVPNNPQKLTSAEAVVLPEDHGKLVYVPSSGTYFNSSDGAYFAMYYPYNNMGANRVYMIGDILDEDGNIVKEDALLNYEYRSISTFIRQDDQGVPLFGLYAEGKVKAIVICPKKGWGDATSIAPSNIRFYMMEKSTIMDHYEKISSSEYALNDVRMVNDTFTFNTSYTEGKMVVTALGYDAGWEISAVDSNGNELDLDVYKVDGGLVGFYAPAGEITYTLSYMTPYLEPSVILACLGVFLLIAFNCGLVYLEIRKNKEKRAQPLILR